MVKVQSKPHARGLTQLMLSIIIIIIVIVIITHPFGRSLAPKGAFRNPLTGVDTMSQVSVRVNNQLRNTELRG